MRNVGTGVMPVQVAAAAGERFDRTTAEPLPDYRDARTEITLGPGDEQTVVIKCDFKPDRVLMDPDALVLQLKREYAIVRF